MKLGYLVEGKTDEAACQELVEGLAQLYAPQATPIEWSSRLTARCHQLRKSAGPLLRAAGSERAVILTDAWCDPGARSGKGKARGKKTTDVATTNTARVAKMIRTSLVAAGRADDAVGVACAELETWFLLSKSAMRKAGHERRALTADAQPDCDGERVDKGAVAKERLEQLVPNYSAAIARRMAKGIVTTTQSAEALMRASESFLDFASQVIGMLGGEVPDVND